MISSPQFQSNPTLYVFLPIYYTVWSDAVLTPSEVSSIQNLVNKQAWLSAEEKSFLLSQLNPSSPPSAQDLREWFTTIQQVVNQGSADQKLSLTDIGLQLAKQHQSKNGLSAEAIQSLRDIESVLGIISSDKLDADTWDDFDVRAGCERDDYHWPVPSNVGPGVSPAEHITDVLEQR